MITPKDVVTKDAGTQVEGGYTPSNGSQIRVLIGAVVPEYLSVFPCFSKDLKRKWITWFELPEAGLGSGLLQTLLVVPVVLEFVNQNCG